MATSFESRLRELIEKSPASPADRDRSRLTVERILRHGGGSFDGILAIVEQLRLDHDSLLMSCWLLGQLQDERAVNALSHALRNPDASLGWEAAKALVSIGSEKAVAPLIDILQHDGSAHNRSAAAYALGLLGDSRAIAPLIQTLEGRDTVEVRSHAAEALGHIGDAAALHALIVALRDTSAEVRYWAVFALGELADPRAIPELRRVAAQDDAVLSGDRAVSVEAETAIKRITR